MIKTTPLYWDCECEYNYIHEKSKKPFCPVCNTHHDDQPDSRPFEVALLLSAQLSEVSDDGNRETAEFILWASETSRTTQDMISALLGWALKQGYTCIDDLPADMQNGGQ